MAWVKLDERIDEHPKIAAVGPLAAWVFVRGLCYCNRNQTDGFIPDAVARQIGASKRVTEGLTTATLWELAPGGYRVHDYLEYQPSKAETAELQAKRQASGQAGGVASAQARAERFGAANAQAKSKQNSTPVPYPYPDPDKEQEKRRVAHKAVPLPPILNSWNEMVPERLQKPDDLVWLRQLQGSTSVNVDRELGKMARWLMANPSKAPSANWRRFATNWINKAEPSDPPDPADLEQPKTASEIDAQIAEFEIRLAKSTDTSITRALGSVLRTLKRTREINHASTNGFSVRDGTQTPAHDGDGVQVVGAGQEGASR